MLAFISLNVAIIYRVVSKSSRLYSGYRTGYYMTLDVMEAVLTPNSRSRRLWEKDEDGKDIKDENHQSIPVLDDNGRQKINFVYDEGGWRDVAPKKGSIWMIRIPDALIETVGVYETQNVEVDSDYWDDPDVPEYELKDVKISTRLNREVGERPEIDPNDLYLVQTKHIDYYNWDSVEEFYARADERYLEQQASQAQADLAQVTHKRRVSELSDDTWDFFLDTDGDRLFDAEVHRGRSNREEYTEGEAHYDGSYRNSSKDYRPRISYGTLYAVEELLKELKDAREDVDYYRELWQKASGE